MARLIAAYGTSHSTMLFSSAEHWQALFDHIDCKAPIAYFEGTPRTFDELLATTSPAAAANIAKDTLARRHAETEAAMNRLEADIAKAAKDILAGASLDNNIVCSDEKEIIAVDAIARKWLRFSQFCSRCSTKRK